MKLKELETKILKNKVGKSIILVCLVITVLLIAILFIKNKEAEIDTTYIISTLEKSSELTTAKLTYKGFSSFKDTGIPIINRSDFLMVYTATARAGIDVKEIDVSADHKTKTIVLTIPKAKILDIKVEPSDIKYYDEKFALFNVNQKEDSDRAKVLAENEAKVEISKMGILKMADDQAEALIKGLLQDTVPKDYKIDVKQK